LKYTNDENMENDSWMANTKSYRRANFAKGKREKKDKNEGIEIGSSEEMVTRRFKYTFAISLRIAKKCIRDNCNQ
jgi:hypothetical protein